VLRETWFKAKTPAGGIGGGRDQPVKEEWWEWHGRGSDNIANGKQYHDLVRCSTELGDGKIMQYHQYILYRR